MAEHDISQVWMTPQTKDRLKEELEDLLSVRIPAVEDALGEAQKSGDIVDNGDLDAALSEKAMLEARAAQLEAALAAAVVRDAPDDLEVASVGAMVTVTDDDGDSYTFLFASPENKIPGYTILSPRSPMGQALLGAEVGATVEFKTPKGPASVTLDEVSPFKPPEK